MVHFHHLVFLYIFVQEFITTGLLILLTIKCNAGTSKKRKVLISQLSFGIYVDTVIKNSRFRVKLKRGALKNPEVRLNFGDFR